MMSKLTRYASAMEQMQMLVDAALATPVGHSLGGHRVTWSSEESADDERAQLICWYDYRADMMTICPDNIVSFGSSGTLEHVYHGLGANVRKRRIH
jgi:hypothetical protein